MQNRQAAQSPRRDPDPVRTGAQPAPRLRIGHAACIAALLAAVSGLNSLSNNFAYDDNAIIHQNPQVTGPGHILDVFSHHYWEHIAIQRHEKRADFLYRPLTVLTYRLNYIANGLDPFGYHLVNLLLHVTVSVLVTILAVRLGCTVVGGLVAGALFAVMPIHAEAVANVVGRAELLTSLWVLIASLLAIRIRFDTLAGGLAWAVAAALAALAALLSKENGAAALVVIPLLTATNRPNNPVRDRIRKTLLVAAMLVPPVIAYAALRYHATAGQMALTDPPTRVAHMMVDVSSAERFWGPWQTFGLYVAKTFWPRVLCFDYSYKAFTLAGSPLNPHVVLGMLTLAGLIAAAVVWWGRGRRQLAIACLAVVVAYFPVSNTIFLRTLFAERVWYLPSAFLAVVLGGLATTWLVNQRRLAIILVVVSLAVVAGLWRSWVRNAEWRDSGTLFAAGYRDHPDSAQVLLCYGRWLAHHDRAREAIPLLNRCVEIAPEMTNAFVALGRAYLQLGDDRQAVAALQIARKQNPDNPDVRDLLRETADRLAAAWQSTLDRLRRHCESQPASLPLFLDWVNALREAGMTDEAIALFAARQDQFARSADFHHARAVALMLAGRRDEAIDAYRTAATLAPANVEILVEFATALLDRHAPDDLPVADDLIRRAIRIAPDHPRALLAQAEQLDQQGKHQEAVAIYQRLVRTLPPGPLRSAIQSRLDLAR